MKVLVELNRKEDNFQIKEEHKVRLVKEFPQHSFEFIDSYKEFKERLSEAEVALVWLFPQRLFEAAVNLQALYTPAAGKNWVAEDPSGRVKSYFSSFHGGMIAESFMTMLLYNNNNLSPAIKNKEAANWDREAFGVRSLLKNKSLLIAGYGNIGYSCAQIAKSFGMNVVGACRNLAREANCQLLDIQNITDYIGEYDHVLNLLPGDESTTKFFSSDLLLRMKDGASFYNFGRGTTVDEDALCSVLDSNKLRFAGLDVFSEEPLPSKSALWEASNCVMTPHSSCIYTDYLHLFIDELKEKL